MADGLTLQPDHLRRLNEMLRWYETKRGSLDAGLRRTLLPSGHILSRDDVRFGTLDEDLSAGGTASVTLTDGPGGDPTDWEVDATDWKLPAEYILPQDTVVLVHLIDGAWYVMDWELDTATAITDVRIDSGELQVKTQEVAVPFAVEESPDWATKYEFDQVTLKEYQYTTGHKLQERSTVAYVVTPETPSEWSDMITFTQVSMIVDWQISGVLFQTKSRGGLLAEVGTEENWVTKATGTECV